MLKKIYIRNIVLINEMEISLSNGLHVFTGETGAGKSILLEGLGLALGARANFSLIGNYKNDSEVKAEFIISKGHPIVNILHEFNISYQENLILRRVISNNGISRGYVNNIQVSLNELNKIGQKLVEVQGQFDNHSLLDSKEHICLLDQFGGYTKAIELTKKNYEELHNAKKEFSEFKINYNNYEKDYELKRVLLSDLEKIIPKENEENDLIERRALISDSSKLIKMLSEAHQNISGEQSISNLLNNSLKSLERFDTQNNKSLKSIIEILMRASNELNEAEIQISSLINSINTDPNELDDIDNRLFTLRNFARKANCETNKLYSFYQELLKNLDVFEDRDLILKNKEDNLNKKIAVFKESSIQLRNLRISAALKLDKYINEELPFLKLDQAKFKTFIKERNENDWNANGSDEVIFNISTNPQQNFMPLGKVASGGELSRFLLAIKVVLANSARFNTLVFDEVDSGVGGQTADAVGTRLFKLSERNQVIVITHSPQVAAKGKNHYLIEKVNSKDQSITLCNKSSYDNRIEEISRMLSGEKISDEARAAAIQLINE